ncbi:hypothetical protein ACFE04_030454 [Oxalis oulophora]
MSPARAHTKQLRNTLLFASCAKEVTTKAQVNVVMCDIISLTVHEPKLKVDFTAYVEKYEFTFDVVLDEDVTMYQSMVEPSIPTIYKRTNATFFAYTKIGSVKMFPIQPLPLRVVEELFGRLTCFVPTANLENVSIHLYHVVVTQGNGGETWFKVGRLKTYTHTPYNIGHVLKFKCVVVDAK